MAKTGFEKFARNHAPESQIQIKKIEDIKRENVESSPVPEDVSDVKTKRKGISKKDEIVLVNFKIPFRLKDKLDEIRYKTKTPATQTIIAALEEYFLNHNL